MSDFWRGVCGGGMVGMVLGSMLGCRLWLRARQTHAESLRMASRGLRALMEGNHG